MSPDRQDELTRLIEMVLALPAVAALSPDVRLRRIHHDWLEAGDLAQRTVARLSRQLRRYHLAPLARLTPDETALYEDLVANRLADRLRLEQERISFRWLRRALALFNP